MKLINSIISFLFGLWLLFAIVTVIFQFPNDFKNLNWNSLESFAILLFIFLFGFYCLKNILVPFKKKEVKKRERILLITMHSLVLLLVLIFSFGQYTYMNPMNIVINILVLVFIIYLIAYQIISWNAHN